jgi:hypothetical protein
LMVASVTELCVEQASSLAPWQLKLARLMPQPVPTHSAVSAVVPPHVCTRKLPPSCDATVTLITRLVNAPVPPE